MSEYLEYGGLEDDTKELQKKIWGFFNTDYRVLYDVLHDVYEQAVSDTREQVAQEIEKHLEKNIDLQPWIDIRNFRFCANIARGNNEHSTELERDSRTTSRRTYSGLP